MAIPKVSAFLVVLALGPLLGAGEKKAPQASGGNDSVMITATLVSPEEVRQVFGTDFDKSYTVLDVTIEPRGDKPYVVSLNDFILRSESSLEHSGPMAAGQIAGTGEVVVQRTYGNRPNADSPRPLAGTKLEMKDDAKGNPAFEELKKRILVEKNITAPETGLLFFPLAKEKPKNLVLSYTSPAGKVRMTFK